MARRRANYTVDHLVDHRLVKRGRGYRIEFQYPRPRWKNYGPEHDTWEPRKNLLTCNAEIRAYKADRGLEITASDEEKD
jgi:hypothetical protein